MYQRVIQDIIAKYENHKEIVILYGARQIGKTTVLHQMLDANPNALILNCERPEIAKIFDTVSIVELKLVFQNKKIIALDEAQTIKNIGKILKLLYDSPEFDQKFIATGSSSFDLSNKIIEPLTGRNITLQMFPFMYEEITKQKSWLWVKENLEDLLLFGAYPGIIDKPISEKAIILSQLAGDYLYKDILAIENIKNPSLLRKLLQLLALQIGSQVSIHEIAMQLGVAVQTVERYIDLLEKSFVIFSLSTFSKNLRNEIKKSKKYYFYDLGIRNAIINNFQTLATRTDKGGMWENFCISERVKRNKTKQQLVNMYFWKTYDGAEIDYIEEKDGNIYAFECKWNTTKKIKFPDSFLNEYKPSITQGITPENIHEFLL